MENGSFLQEFVAGNAGGLLGISTVYPLDTAKIRLQTNPQQYSGFTDVIKTMIKSNGVTSLYRGLASPACGFGLTFAISFSGYGYCRRFISTQKRIGIDDLTTFDLFVAGGVTGAIQSPVRAVVERLKSVMQVKEQENGRAFYRGSGSCMIELIKKEGIRNGLFQGFSSVVLREVPQFAVYYPTYEILKGKFLEEGLNSTFAQFLAGGLAGCIQWLPPIYCIDVVKSRMQTAPRGYYKGVSDCVDRILKEEGVATLFRGLSPALLRAFPLHAIIFVSYELTMNLMKGSTS